MLWNRKFYCCYSYTCTCNHYFSPSTGSSGQTVAINGSGFTGASAVNFNGISATFSVINDGLINATIPAGSTTGLISVVTPCGTANSLSNFSGNGVFTFPGSALGNSYYIIVKHRNSLETWSGSAIPFPSTSNSFDFTTLVTQAFGGNQVQVSTGKWAIRSGDVNQDGAINTSDYSFQPIILLWKIILNSI
ncbi:MAG: hypothetical protein IPN88_10395 [Bacteroidetes bacterium]|nr:hypothetical protein [Bacteroidota bacterium]